MGGNLFGVQQQSIFGHLLFNIFLCDLFFIIKGTLKQIWKTLYVFVFLWKKYPEHFAFLIQGIPELFAREVCKFLKK